MKAIAAIAIARKFSIEENAAAGLVVAGLVAVFSITGLIEWANRVTPIPVVKGIQVGAGLSLCLSAGSKMLSPLYWTSPSWNNNAFVVIAAVILLLLTIQYARLPYALIVFTIGILIAIFSPENAYQNPDVNTKIPVVLPPWTDFLDATTTASLGQLPLTLLNSVIAASALASDLLPSPPNPMAPTVTELGISVSVINLIGCWFGSMPACHGSGGLAGQYRFGARSGSSIIFLGSIKVLLGIITLWKPAAILGTLANFPKSLLGVLVLAAGVELAKVGESINSDARDLRVLNEDSSWDGKRVEELDERTKKERWMTMFVTIAALLTFKNDAIGFIVGLAWHWCFKTARTIEERRRSSSRGNQQNPTEHTGLLANEGADRIA